MNKRNPQILITLLFIVLSIGYTTNCKADFLPVLITPNTVVVNDRTLIADTSYYRLILKMADAKVFDKILMKVDTNVEYSQFISLIEFFSEHNLTSIYFYVKEHDDLYSFTPNRTKSAFIAKNDSLKLVVIIRNLKVEIGYRKNITSFNNVGGTLDSSGIDTFLLKLSSEANKYVDASDVTIAADSFVQFGKVAKVLYLCHKNGFYDKAFATTRESE